MSHDPTTKPLLSVEEAEELAALLLAPAPSPDSDGDLVVAVDLRDPADNVEPNLFANTPPNSLRLSRPTAASLPPPPVQPEIRFSRSLDEPASVAFVPAASAPAPDRRPLLVAAGAIVAAIALVVVGVLALRALTGGGDDDVAVETTDDPGERNGSDTTGQGQAADRGEVAVGGVTTVPSEPRGFEDRWGIGSITKPAPVESSEAPAPTARPATASPAVPAAPRTRVPKSAPTNSPTTVPDSDPTNPPTTGTASAPTTFEEGVIPDLAPDVDPGTPIWSVPSSDGAADSTPDAPPGTEADTATDTVADAVAGTATDTES